MTRNTDKTYECPKCFGRCYMNEFSHVHAGRCFYCGGAGRVPEFKRDPHHVSREDADANRAEWARNRLRDLWRAARRPGFDMGVELFVLQRCADTDLPNLLALAPEARDHLAAQGWPVDRSAPYREAEGAEMRIQRDDSAPGIWT